MVREKMLTTKQTAERLGAGESSIKLWCVQGRFPNAERFGRAWMIPEKDLSGFEKQKPGPKPSAPKKGKAK